MSSDAADLTQAAAAGNNLIEILQRMAKSNTLDEQLFDSKDALEHAYRDLVVFTEEAAASFKIDGLSQSKVVEEIAAEKAGEAASEKIKAILGDKAIAKKDRANNLIMALEQERWPSWRQL